jgi:ADP-ribose pyrophosphatase
MKYNKIDKVEEDELVYNGFLKIRKSLVKFDAFNGKSITKDFEIMERGNSVAVLIKEIDTNQFLFTNQFRYATTKENSGWLIEIPAGGLKNGEDPENCAKREVQEELGYIIRSELKLICKFYVSPGGTTEMISLYYAEVTSSDKTSNGGGLKYQKEDIELVKIPVNDVFNLIGNTIIDGKSIIALQWFKIIINNKGNE